MCNIQSKNGDKCPYERFYGRLPNYAKNLKIFGKIGIKVSKSTNQKEKLVNKRDFCVFLGYPNDHAADAFRVLDLKSKTFMITKDVRWTNKTYGQYFKNNSAKILELTELESSDEDEIVVKNSNTQMDNARNQSPTPVERHGMITRSKALIGDIYSSESEDDEIEPRNKETGLFMSNSPEDEEPNKIQDAWNHKNPEKRKSWRTAIENELNSMIHHDVWEMIHKNDIPPGRSPVGNKWIFKEKRNGQFRARLVALGYSQVPGIDFLNNYSPVVNDTSVRILLVLIKKNNLEAWSLDVETAFLNGELEKRKSL